MKAGTENEKSKKKVYHKQIIEAETKNNETPGGMPLKMSIALRRCFRFHARPCLHGVCSRPHHHKAPCRADQPSAWCACSASGELCTGNAPCRFLLLLWSPWGRRTWTLTDFLWRGQAVARQPRTTFVDTEMTLSRPLVGQLAFRQRLVEGNHQLQARVGNWEKKSG